MNHLRLLNQKSRSEYVAVIIVCERKLSVYSSVSNYIHFTFILLNLMQPLGISSSSTMSKCLTGKTPPTCYHSTKIQRVFYRTPSDTKCDSFHPHAHPNKQTHHVCFVADLNF